MWVNWNPNPVARKVGDCAVRAVARAVGIDWEESYARLALMGFDMGDLPNSVDVWGAVLRQNGFQKRADCPECYTVREFATEHHRGTFVLATDGHVVTVVDGDWFDIWDSGDQPVQFYWFKEESEHG